MRRATLACLSLLLVSTLSVATARAGHGTAALDAADYPSLQAAIDALPDTGGVVTIPPGEYLLDEPLVVEKPDVHLTGAGTSTLIMNRNTTGQAAIVVRPANFADNPRARLWRFQVSNLRLVGSAASGHGIEAQGVNEFFAHGITVTDHGGDGIRLDQCYEDPRIADCLLTYNDAAGLHLLGCHDIVVCGNHFEENQDALRCVDGFNLCMSGNNLDDHLRHGVVIENTYGSIVSSNMIEECQGTAIILDRDCYGITLSANVIAHDFGGGIDLRDAQGCTVGGNSFPICGQFGLRIGPDSSRITVSGNTFSDTYIGGGARRRTIPEQNVSAGIRLEATREINITGNTFSSLSTPAVDTAGQPSRLVIFAHNLLVDVAFDPSGLEESIVEGNLASGGDAAAASE